MQFSYLLTLALTATAASASPASSTAPPKSKEFTIDFTITLGDVTEFFKAQAVANGSDTSAVVLVGNPSPQSKGTPAFFTGNSTHAELNFDLTASPHRALRRVWSAVVPEVGDAYNVTRVVHGLPEQQDFGWAYDADHGVSHQLQDALNSFYLCSDVVSGKEAMVLKWGMPTFNGTALTNPAGCQRAQIMQSLMFQAARSRLSQ